MLPTRIRDKFIEIETNATGKILTIGEGVFALSEFIVDDSIYSTCAFLESILDSLPLNEPFLINCIIVNLGGKEYNVDVDLFKNENTVRVLIINRTSTYQHIRELNQNRNEISIVKHQIDRQNKELTELREVAEKATEEKSRFLAMMSHEVRNPLNAILGYAGMIATESTCPTALGYVKSLRVAGNNLKVIVNDILDISRIEAGKLELAFESMSLYETIEMCIENFELQHKMNNVRLKYTVSDKIPKQVLGDAVRLTQILSNLINNAFKFTKKGSIILNVTLNSETEDSNIVQFTLADTGRGMTKEQIRKIFNEYEQVELNDNRVYGGAGLGLSIVKRLVEAMKGKITLVSQVDIGSTFNIQIPFKKATNFDAVTSNQSKSKQQKYDLKGAEVLYADDDELNHVIVAHLLSKEGANTTLVNDGVEALSVLKKKKFDIVLLDIHMPNKSGVDLIKEKYLFTKYNDKTPLLAITADTNKKDVDRYIDLGFLDVISKPYTPEQLIQTIGLYFKN